MSIKIRLARHGRKKAPYYRMVVADARFPRDGRFIEILGIYQPLNKEPAEQIRVDEAKALKWLNEGAQPSDTCRSLLRKQGIMKKFHEAKAAAKAAHKAAKEAKPVEGGQA
jgi:small subunit ribosomal protein S16